MQNEDNPYVFLEKTWVMEMACSALCSICFSKWHTVWQAHAHTQTTRLDHRFRGLGFWATVQDSSQEHRKWHFLRFAGHTEKKRERGGEREVERERESLESEWEFLSGNRAFTVSYYTEKRRKRRRVNGGQGLWRVVQPGSVFNVAACVSAVQLSGFMDSLTVENVLLCSGPCPD